MKTSTKEARDARDGHDAAALARQVEGLDAARYFDARADAELRVAVTRWPAFARLMRLTPARIEDAVRKEDAARHSPRD
ncbi:hypothetical protein [Caballeronia sp. J97]|uniref:hypothetical protein n=1 Tax=Caballeronia sp. J97 TaxID=2805429 RepID=UPI002AB036E9|nr:hypothetical protein [Caballeronia sp. J97]